MYTNKILSILGGAFLLMVCTASSCKREEPVEIAGKGGNASIKAIPKHHSKYITDCTMYIKYNTNDKPAAVFSASQYDDSLKCTTVDGIPSATFTGLKKGKYYVYGVGTDPAVATNNGRVEAGKPVTITADQEYEINIPVTEGD